MMWLTVLRQRVNENLMVLFCPDSCYWRNKYNYFSFLNGFITLQLSSLIFIINVSVSFIFIAIHT